MKSIKRTHPTKWAEFEVEFVCYKSLGEEITTTEGSFTGKTTNPYTDDISILGTYKAQTSITITINSLTKDSGDRFIQLKNTDNGDYVKIIADDFTANDVIIISHRTALVTRNGVVTEYLGIMPEWLVGTNNWEYSDDFNTRNVDIDFSYKKQYI